MKVVIKKSTNKDKKYMAIFYDGEKKIKTTHFGLKNADDYTLTGDFTINGNTIKNGNLTITGNITIAGGGSGTVNASGCTINLSGGDVVADGISLKNHTHTGDSGGTTSPPN